MNYWIKRFIKTSLFVAGLILIIMIPFLEFRECGYESWDCVLMTLHNIPKIFAADPVIELNDVWTSVKNYYSPPPLSSRPSLYRHCIDILYCVAVCLAPVCTALAIVRALKHWISMHYRLIRQCLRKRVYIFGWNEDVQQLIKQQKHKKGKSYQLHIITADETPRDSEHLYWKDGVFFHYEDCLLMPPNTLKGYLASLKIRRSHKIIFFETSDSRNLSLYLALNSLKKSPVGKTSCYLACRNGDIKHLIEETVSTTDNEAFSKNLKIFSPAELRIRKMYQETPLYTHSISNLKLSEPPNWDIHLMIVGFGSMGEQALYQAAQFGVITSQNKIIVDVIDKNAPEKHGIFLSKVHSDCVETNGNTSTLKALIADGTLCVRFHQLDLLDICFRKTLESLHEELPFTYFVICTEDSATTAHCMSEVNRLLLSVNSDKKTPVAVRLESENLIAEYIKNDDSRYKNVFPISSNQDILTLDAIFDEIAENESKNFHWEYNTLSGVISPPKSDSKTTDTSEKTERNCKTLRELFAKKTEEFCKTLKELFVKKTEEFCKTLRALFISPKDAAWNKAPYYMKESSRVLSYHESVKDLILLYRYWISPQIGKPEEPFDKYLDELIQKPKDRENHIKKSATKIFKCAKPNPSYKLSKKSFAEPLGKHLSKTEDSLLVEQARTEHRRWCYFSILNGWGSNNPKCLNTESSNIESDVPPCSKPEPDKLKKDVFQRLNPTLCNWAILRETYQADKDHYILCYDALSLIRKANLPEDTNDSPSL